MQKPVRLTVLNIEGNPVAVESLPDEIKALVETFNDWTELEAVVQDEAARFKYSKEMLSHQIIGKVREHMAEQEEDKTKDAVDSEAVVQDLPTKKV